MDDLLRFRLANSKELPSIPTIAVKIIDLANDATATSSDIAEVVCADPALVAKIMRFANSPIYKRPRVCDTLSQAITFMGLNATIMVALSFSLFAALGNQRDSGLNMKLYWRRSLLCAAAGRVLAGHSTEAVNADEVFLACLLQDIGVLALNTAVPELYRQVSTFQDSHKLLISYEKIYHKVDHALVGTWLLEQWNLPAELTRCVGLSHQPKSLADGSPQLAQARCVALSGYMADAYLVSEPEESLQKAMTIAEEFWQVDHKWIDMIIDAMAVEIPIIEQLFDIDVSEPGVVENLLQVASELTPRYAVAAASNQFNY